MGLGRQLRSASETDFFMKQLHRLFVLMLVFIVHDWFDLFGAALSIVVPTVVKLSQNPYTYKKEYAREFNFRDNAEFVPVHVAAYACRCSRRHSPQGPLGCAGTLSY